MDRVLPVKSVDDIDLTQPPATAEEYLAQVRLEASQLPEVLGVRKSEDASEDMEDKAPVNSAESLTGWQNEQLGVFSAMRQNVAHLRASTKPNGKARQISDNDEQAWRQFCLGGPNGHAQDGHAPQMSILCHYGQQKLIQLLQYHTKWLETHVTRNRGLWIYALLVCLDKLQTGTTIAGLRDLARACIRLKNKAAVESQERVAIVLIVTIIAYYFQQLDFADSFADRSSSAK